MIFRIFPKSKPQNLAHTSMIPLSDGCVKLQGLFWELKLRRLNVATIRDMDMTCDMADKAASSTDSLLVSERREKSGGFWRANVGLETRVSATGEAWERARSASGG